MCKFRAGCGHFVDLPWALKYKPGNIKEFQGLKLLCSMFYAHIEIVVAVLVVIIFSCLIVTSEGAGVMTWEFG